MRTNRRNLMIVTFCCIFLILAGTTACSKTSTAKGDTTSIGDNKGRQEDKVKSDSVTTKTPQIHSLTIADVKKHLVDQYGESSQNEFVSSLGSNLQTYPAEIFGIVSVVATDVDNNNKDEFIAIRVSPPESNLTAQLVAELYQEKDGQPALICSTPISSLEYCESSYVYIYYSNDFHSYMLVVDSASAGAYTGVDRSLGAIYSISNNNISSYKQLESVPGIKFIDIESEFTNLNIPYAKYCAEIDILDSSTYFKPLCEIEHSLFGDIDFYEDRNHKLIIKSTVTD